MSCEGIGGARERISRHAVVRRVSRAVGYGYNSAGQLTTLTTPLGQTITYGNANNRIASVTVNSTTVLNDVLYNPFGPIRQWHWGHSASFTTRSFGDLSSVHYPGLTVARSRSSSA
jgi:YD repeat-containing protein